MYLHWIFFFSTQDKNLIKEKLIGEAFHLMQNHVENVGKSKAGYRNKKGVLQIAQTTGYYSPTAYSYICSLLSLPSMETLQNLKS